MRRGEKTRKKKRGAEVEDEVKEYEKGEGRQGNAGRDERGRKRGGETWGRGDVGRKSVGRRGVGRREEMRGEERRGEERRCDERKLIGELSDAPEHATMSLSSRDVNFIAVTGAIPPEIPTEYLGSSVCTFANSKLSQIASKYKDLQLLQMGVLLRSA